MGDEENLLSRFLAAVDRLDLTDVHISAVSGLSLATVRMCRVGRVIPARRRAREAFRGFVLLAEQATLKGDLHLGGAV